MPDKICCSECPYVEFLRSSYAMRYCCYCNHPDQKYIHVYFDKLGKKGAPGFLGYSKTHIKTVPLKTSPGWCPKKKGRG